MKLSTSLTLLSLVSIGSASAIRLHTTFAGSNKTTYLCGGSFGLTECMFQDEDDITAYYFGEPAGTIKYVELPPAGIDPVNYTLSIMDYDTSTFPALTFTSTDSGFQAYWDQGSDNILEGIWDDAPVVFYAAKNVSHGQGYDDLFTVGGTVDDIAEYDLSTAVDLQVVTITIDTVAAVPTSQRIA